MITPADIANRALDALGVEASIGDMEEGTREARVLLRHYTTVLEEVSRAANWNFARRTADLTLLQDQTGLSDAPVGTGTPGMGTWVYEYAWPIDCLKARFVTGNPFSSIGSPPPMTGMTGFPGIGLMLPPVPFLVSQDIIPNLVGAIADWAELPDLDNAQGQGFGQQTVILSNTPGARLTYTSLVSEPNIWDPLFQNAVVSLLAARTAMAIVPDKKMALQMQSLVIGQAKRALDQARVADANEMRTNLDVEAIWISARTGHAMDSNINGALAYGSWDIVSFPDGSVY